jgi:hypothetical protein
VPIETIKCQECGSADVTEFKPGTYVCGHCEAVFKHVAQAREVVGCEVDNCGVLAVGRCELCGRAFCGTHGGQKTCEPCSVEASRRSTAAALKRERETAINLFTPTRFVALAASVGNPAIRSWTVNKIGPVTYTYRSGPLKLRTGEYVAQGTVGSFVINGWILDEPMPVTGGGEALVRHAGTSGPGCVMVTDEGRIHRLVVTIPKTHQRSSWGDTSAVAESQVAFDWLGGRDAEGSTSCFDLSVAG